MSSGIDHRLLVASIMDWQAETFEGADLAGVISHLEKELEEVKAKPEDILEWVDLIFLALHGLTILGLDAEDVHDFLLAKLIVNINRQWPAAQPGKATEHVR